MYDFEYLGSIGIALCGLLMLLLLASVAINLWFASMRVERAKKQTFTNRRMEQRKKLGLD